MDIEYRLESMTIRKHGELSELTIPVNCVSANREELVHLKVLHIPDPSQSIEEIQRIGLQRGIEILQGVLDLLTPPSTDA